LRKIAIYGKGGIGKSTTSANLSVCMSKLGLKVLQIGCDPKHDSTRTIMNKFIPTVLDTWRNCELQREKIKREMLVFTGYNGVSCIEAGGPEPGVGCAGRGIIRMIDILEDLEIFDEDFDIVLFDVLGDVVCGGFAKPIQTGYSNEIYIVTSGEFMAMYAANNIAIAISKVGKSRGVKLGGVICNSRALENEKDLVANFAERINSSMIYFIKKDSRIPKHERYAKTVVEAEPESDIAKEYETLAGKIIDNKNLTVPIPLNFQELIELCEKYDSIGVV
jgi:nitrogenase iron protein NifH